MAAYRGIAAHPAYDMFAWYKYLSAILVFFPHLGLLSGNFSLIVSFPDHCLFLPSLIRRLLFRIDTLEVMLIQTVYLGIEEPFLWMI